jgi:hypothetical protein
MESKASKQYMIEQVQDIKNHIAYLERDLKMFNQTQDWILSQVDWLLHAHNQDDHCPSL